MRRLFAFLGDSFREATDRKILLVLGVLSGIIILFCFSLSFEADDLKKALADQAKEVGSVRIHAGPFGGGFRSGTDVDHTVGAVEEVTGPDWPADLQGGHRVDVKFQRVQDVDGLAEKWKEARAWPPGRPRRKPAKVEEEAQAPIDAKGRLAFIEERFRAFGYNHVEARELGADPPEYRVAVRSDYPREVTGAHHMGIGFGLFRFPLEGTSVAEIVVSIQANLANFFAGQVGMIILLVVCSSFVPNMLGKGTVDFVLARPLGRARILLFKYLGGIGFVSILAGFLIGGCWLALSLRTGYFNFWFLATILTVTAVFAVLYSISVLFGVLTRSGAVSAILSIGLWFVSSSIVGARQAVKMLVPAEELPKAVKIGLDAAYAVLPKTTDLGYLNVFFLSKSHLSPAAMARMEQMMPSETLKVDWLYSLGTTAAFTAVMLALAVWFFRRRDF
jgi:ABC-type transport system involved in multi-copper enzyme maturation permease subunit